MDLHSLSMVLHPMLTEPTQAQRQVEFSTCRKRLVLAVGIICALNGTLGSSLPSGATVSLTNHFGDSGSSVSIVLLNSLYMMGFTLSPLVFGPLSENIGRRPVLVGSYTFYTIFTLCCAVAPTYSLLLLFRFFAGTSAAVPNAVVAGLYGDTFGEPKARGQAMAVFMLVSAQGPLFGPLLSGFISVNLSWRWVFWVGLMISGTGLPVVWLVPETNARILETRHTQVTDTEWTRPDIHTLLKSVGTMLARPGAMIIQEPILLFSSFYLALVYAMMYLLFQAYPIVFGGICGFSQDRVGLAYIPIMAGVFLGFAVFHVFEAYYAKAEKDQRAWTQVEENRRLPLACLGAPCIIVAPLSLGLTAEPRIHPAVSMIVCGISFGMGYMLIFLAMLIYLSDVYKRYSASAQAAASTVRSMAAVCLPFAAPTMYHDLGVKYAGIVLACVFGIMAVIPFMFLFLGQKLRANSRLRR